MSVNKYRYRLHFDTYFLIILNFLWVFKDFLNKHGYNLDDVSENCYSKPSLNKGIGYEVIISVHHVSNTILLPDSNYIVDVVLWPNFGNSSISIRAVSITSIL